MTRDTRLVTKPSEPNNGQSGDGNATLSEASIARTVLRAGSLAEAQGRSKPINANIHVDLEEEVRLYTPRDMAEQMINLDQLPKVQIEQSYFPKGVRNLLFVIAAHSAEMSEFMSRLKPTQARIRKVTDGNEESFSLDVKAKMPDGPRIARQELRYQGIIDADLFAELQEQTVGTIAKVRHFKNGIAGSGDVEMPFTLEIDVPKWRRIGSTVQDLQGLNLLFQEVESNSQGLRGLVRQGETNVPLIASGFDVSLDMDTAKLRSPLSNVKLATYADFDDLVEAAAKLQKRWGKWMAKAG